MTGLESILPAVVSLIVTGVVSFIGYGTWRNSITLSSIDQRLKSLEENRDIERIERRLDGHIAEFIRFKDSLKSKVC